MFPPVTGGLPAKGAADTVALLPVTTDAVAHTINGPAVNLPRPRNGFLFELDVTAAAAAAGDTLAVKVQTTVDGGTNWIDVCSFTLATGTGGVVHTIGQILATAATAMFANGALAAGSVRNLFGDQYRVTYTIVDGGAHGQNFTFNVNACPF